MNKKNSNHDPKSQFLVEISNKVIGSYGEKVASHYLESKGYKILGRNIRLKRGEIDILAFKNKVIFIIEVKTIRCVSGTSYRSKIEPEDNFSPMKLRKLRLLREEWLNDHAGVDEDLDVRIDGLAAVLWTKKGERESGAGWGASNLVCKVDKIKIRHYPSIA